MTRRPTPVAVVHPGNQHSWQTAMALDQLGRLEFYATSIFYRPDVWPYNLVKLLPGSLRARVERELRRFEQPGLDPARVRTAGLAEWLERIAMRLGQRQLAGRLDRLGNRVFARALARTLASDAPFAVWGYNGSSRELFEEARRRDRFTILDRTIGDWRAFNRIMAGVHEAYAEYFPEGDYRIPDDRIRRDDAEYELADAIVVGCDFCAETITADAQLPAAVKDRVRVLNYCYDERLFGGLPSPDLDRKGPLRFLFLGQAGPRKGFHLVLKTFARIPRSAAELTVIGDMQVPADVFARYADRISYRRTVPRSEVPVLLQQADVLLFPTYFEGGGIVLHEALAAGVALIQSKNADIAVTSETGLLMPEISETALHDAVMAAIDDPDRVRAWRAAAQGAARRFSFARYRDGIAQLLAASGI
jgi:glycosyltransferase involved in cell wall biosynthesis